MNVNWLQHAGAHASHRERVFYDAPIILNDIICSGAEKSLTECPQTGNGNFDNCSLIAVAHCQGIMFGT